MGYHIAFVFEGTICTCSVYVDSTKLPVFIFLILHDQWLIDDFSDELTIQTDFHKVLPRKDDTASLVALRQAIFSALTVYPQFINAKSAYLQCSS